MQKEELHLIIKEGEGLRAEFKEHYSSKIDKDIVAFANSKGGYLILGVDDNGEITGEILTNKLKAEIIDLARKCEPSIAIKKISQLNKTIVIEIGESFEKPHSCSHGYFRRLDAVTQKMSQHEIKLLFKESLYKTSFEEIIHQHATWDDISRDKINNFLKEAKLKISDFDVPNIFSSLGLAIKSSIKNAGILFFAKQPRKLISQCQMTLAAFKGINRTVIYDRIDIQDDLLTQFNEAMKFLQKHINVRSEIKEINRKDIYEIPLAALREAVANAIIHRDYGIYGTSLMVEIHEDRVVICNPGGIPEGIDIQSLTHISMRRNELIADLFARIDKAERMGTGLRRIYEIMESAGLPKPQIESNLFFTITFKRPFYSPSTDKVIEINSEMILNEIRKNSKISAKKLAEIFGVSSRAIEKRIVKLKADGVLERVGHDRTGDWKINE